MAQYWLQTPIENAKEVVQRFIDDNDILLPSLQGKIVTYTTNCEVIYYQDYLPDSPHESDEILFGTFYCGGDEDRLQVSITDPLGSGVFTFDTSSYPVKSGQYPYIIWNDLVGSPLMMVYFVGYKFKLV